MAFTRPRAVRWQTIRPGLDRTGAYDLRRRLPAVGVDAGAGASGFRDGVAAIRTLRVRNVAAPEGPQGTGGATSELCDTRLAGRRTGCHRPESSRVHQRHVVAANGTGRKHPGTAAGEERLCSLLWCALWQP